MSWIKCADAMPEKSIPVIACGKNGHGNWRRIRAEWVPFHGRCNDDDWEDFAGDLDCDEETGKYYWPEGWYESNECEETSWHIDFEITHWQLFPPVPEEERTPRAHRKFLYVRASD